MKKTTLFLILIFSLSINFSCTYTEKIRDGRTAFERKQYSVAVPMLEKEYTRASTKKDRIALAMQIAESLEKTGKNEAALQWYKKAADADEANIDATKAYALALKKDEQYTEAIKVFKALGISLGSPFEYRKDIENCQNAAKWKTARTSYIIDKQAFNSLNDDYAPAFYSAEQLVITSDRNTNIKDEKYKWTGKSFSDLYVVDKNSGAIKPFSSQINTPANEGTATFNADFSLMVFVRNAAENTKDDQYTKLYFAEKQGVLWSQAAILPFCAEKINYWHPALSADGKTLIFSVNGEDGYGGFDLFITQKLVRIGQNQNYCLEISTRLEMKFFLQLMPIHSIFLPIFTLEWVV
jgi:peptidoglycan-associated lipoprotein